MAVCNSLYTTAQGLEQLRAEHEATFGDTACPQWVKDSLARYVEHGVPIGDCLRAVLANDLQGAFARSDIETAKAMAAIAGYVYRHVPRGMHGSYEAVDYYLRFARDERARAAAQDSDAPRSGR